MGIRASYRQLQPVHRDMEPGVFRRAQRLVCLACLFYEEDYGELCPYAVLEGVRAYRRRVAGRCEFKLYFGASMRTRRSLPTRNV